MKLELNHNEATILATALQGFINSQREVLERIENITSAHNTRVHVEGEIAAAEALRSRVNDLRWD
jgi:glycerol kinase